MYEEFHPAPEAVSTVGGIKPPLVTVVIIAVLSAAAAALFPEFGLLSLLAFSTGTVYITSAKASVPVLVIPALGIAVAVLRGGVILGGVVAVGVVAALVAGWILRSGGDFHRALMMYTLLMLAAAVLAVAVYVRMKGITVEAMSEAYTRYFHQAMTRAIQSVSDSIPAETADALIAQYEAVAQVSFVYVPAVAAMVIEVIGLVAIRLAGLLHDITGSTVYRDEQRPAAVSRVFAVIYIVSAILGATVSGVVGACMANIMMIFMIPAAAAGVSSYRRMITERRMAGIRRIPPSLLILILVSVLFSPMVGLMVLSLTGAFDAFRRQKSGGR